MDKMAVRNSLAGSWAGQDRYYITVLVQKSFNLHQQHKNIYTFIMEWCHLISCIMGPYRSCLSVRRPPIRLV